MGPLPPNTIMHINNKKGKTIDILNNRDKKIIKPDRKLPCKYTSFRIYAGSVSSYVPNIKNRTVRNKIEAVVTITAASKRSFLTIYTAMGMLKILKVKDNNLAIPKDSDRIPIKLIIESHPIDSINVINK
tara:strand:+ start:101 stop:490 length:390 start_codon:yes stop_codon:yes gene_type:complete